MGRGLREEVDLKMLKSIFGLSLIISFGSIYFFFWQQYNPKPFCFIEMVKNNAGLMIAGQRYGSNWLYPPTRDQPLNTHNGSIAGARFEGGGILGLCL